MKITILSVSIAALLGCMTLSSYGQQNVNKIAKTTVYKPATTTDLSDPSLDLNVTKNDSVVNFSNFKSDAEENIESNEKNLADLKTKKCANDSVAKVFQNKVEDLDKQNSDLKIKLANCTGNKCNKDFEAFKSSFNDDLESVTNSILALEINDKK